MDGGVGDDYVDLAVLVFDPIGDLTKCLDVADVGFHRRCAPAVVLDLRNRLFEFILCCGNGIRRRADWSGDVERNDGIEQSHNDMGLVIDRKLNQHF